jgi:UDP-N-acetylmuramoyl-L-alanyl-D-glutamate--2,6-diaminopimelate ligase
MCTRKNLFPLPTEGKQSKPHASLAERGDIILLAGKGHEKYQEIKGVKYPFDDMEILTETLNYCKADVVLPLPLFKRTLQHAGGECV